MAGRQNKPRPSSEIFYCLNGTPSTYLSKRGKHEQQSVSLSVVRHPPSRDHPATDSIRGWLSLFSATVSPVARLA